MLDFKYILMTDLLNIFDENGKKTKRTRGKVNLRPFNSFRLFPSSIS